MFLSAKNFKNMFEIIYLLWEKLLPYLFIGILTRFSGDSDADSSLWGISLLWAVLPPFPPSSENKGASSALHVFLTSSWKLESIPEELCGKRLSSIGSELLTNSDSLVLG